MPRKRAKAKTQPVARRRNPLVDKPAGSVWTETGDHGEIFLYGAFVDDSMKEELGSFDGYGIFAVVWNVPMGGASGCGGVVTSPWNQRPLRIYPSVQSAIESETLRWKQAKGYA